MEDLKGLGRRLTEAKGRKVDYTKEDDKPFLVNVESASRNVAGLHYSDLSKMLYKIGVNGVKDVKKTGYNKVGVTFDSFEEANKLLYNDEMKNRKMKTYIPQSMLSIKGIIRDVGFTIEPEDIIGDSECRAKIIEARRISRRVGKGAEAQFVPTRTVQITFEGKHLPKEIRLYSVNYKVDIYIRSVTQCFKCLRYGHAKKYCRGKFRCSKCGQEHSREVCERKDAKEWECCICTGNHEATSRECPEMSRQKLINETMAMDNITFFEACLRFPATYLATNKTYRTNRNIEFPSLQISQVRNLQNIPQNSAYVNQGARPRSRDPSRQRNTGINLSQWSQRVKNNLHRTPPKKRNQPLSPEAEGFDREAHRKCLFPSEARVRVEEMPQYQVFAGENQESRERQEDRWWNEENMEISEEKSTDKASESNKEEFNKKSEETLDKFFNKLKNKKSVSSNSERERKEEGSPSRDEGASPLI